MNKEKEFLFEVIEEFEGFLINPNTNKPFNNEDIESLKFQIEEEIKTKEKLIYTELNSKLTKMYLSLKKVA